MTNIDENVKAYLIACLVSGIHVEYDVREFMVGIVEHMNSLPERTYWAIGDEDGVIIHDKYDAPILSLIYNGQTLKFTMFQTDEFVATEMHRDAGLMLLNVLGFIRDLDLEAYPECARNMTSVRPNQHDDNEDWSL